MPTENQPRFVLVVVVDHKTARQNTETALDDAHMRVEHDGPYAVIPKLGPGKGQKHDIIGSKQFFHDRTSSPLRFAP